MDNPFDYQTAFSRNIGWVTETEQEVLRNKRIAIAGVGGVGGIHLLTLARLGIGKFQISDLDIFELANFNRQVGASMSQIGRSKVEVMAEMAMDINPQLDLKIFPEGINSSNIEEFLDGVDLYVDGLDFFVLDVRREVFAACAEKGIPAITAAPLGIGSALLCFVPGKMTFEEYFRLEGKSKDEQQLRFLLGLSPAMLQMPYLVDDSRVDLEAQKGPSTPMACSLCAGMAATQAMKILLNRGPVTAAPYGLHFDAFRNKLATTWRPWGNNNPIQRLGMIIARKKLSEKNQGNVCNKEEFIPTTAIERILDLARWAPSGDNTQPWRFELTDDTHFLIHAEDTRDWCVYDLDGRASQIAVGALLENIVIAASAESMQATFNFKEDSPERNLILEVSLSVDTDIIPNPLLPYIKARVTQRRPFSTLPLTDNQKKILEDSVGNGYKVTWIEGRARKWEMAKLLFSSAKIRLTIEEAYDVHKRIIEWNAQFSEDRIPDRAVGLDRLSLLLMKWAMKSWSRVKTLNQYFGGTLLPRILLDLIPALQCAAHFSITSEKTLEGIDDYHEGGRAMQRFWLTATSLGLQFQPEMTPLIFSRYDRISENFTVNVDGIQMASALSPKLSLILGDVSHVNSVFMGRVGVGKTPDSRSLRKPLNKLFID